MDTWHVSIPVSRGEIAGELNLPSGTRSLVIFAHGSGSSRLSPRNRFVAGVFHDAGMGTLLMDLLTDEEEAVDRYTREHRFDIGLLSERLVDSTRWVHDHPTARSLAIGFFGASTGAAAALIAGSEMPETAQAIVSRGGRPDLAGDALEGVEAPTLFIVGALDTEVLELNEAALKRVAAADKHLEIIAGASHLFEEPGTLAKAAGAAKDWFVEHLGTRPGRGAGARVPEHRRGV